MSENSKIKINFRHLLIFFLIILSFADIYSSLRADLYPLTIGFIVLTVPLLLVLYILSISSLKKDKGWLKFVSTLGLIVAISAAIINTSNLVYRRVSYETGWKIPVVERVLENSFRY